MHPATVHGCPQYFPGSAAQQENVDWRAFYPKEQRRPLPLASAA